MAFQVKRLREKLNCKSLAKFRKVFPDLPQSEQLLEEFSCAFQRDVPVNGRMYLSYSYICFHAVVFGWVTVVVIPFADVRSISVRTSGLLLPSSIQIGTDTANYIFASFRGRDYAAQLLTFCWKNTRLEKPKTAAEILDMDEYELSKYFDSTPPTDGEVTATIDMEAFDSIMKDYGGSRSVVVPDSEEHVRTWAIGEDDLKAESDSPTSPHRRRRKSRRTKDAGGTVSDGGGTHTQSAARSKDRMPENTASDGVASSSKFPRFKKITSHGSLVDLDSDTMDSSDMVSAEDFHSVGGDVFKRSSSDRDGAHPLSARSLPQVVPLVVENKRPVHKARQISGSASGTPSSIASSTGLKPKRPRSPKSPKNISTSTPSVLITDEDELSDLSSSKKDLAAPPEKPRKASINLRSFMTVGRNRKNRASMALESSPIPSSVDEKERRKSMPSSSMPVISIDSPVALESSGVPHEDGGSSGTEHEEEEEEEEEEEDEEVDLPPNSAFPCGCASHDTVRIASMLLSSSSGVLNAFDVMFGDASSFQRDFCDKEGCYSDLDLTKWNHNFDGFVMATRSVSFKQLVKSGPFGTKEAHITEKQKQLSKTARYAVVETEAHTTNIPYSDFFDVVTRYCIWRDEETKNTMIGVTDRIIWHKSTWLKGTIEGQVHQKAKEHLKNYIAFLEVSLKAQAKKMRKTTPELKAKSICAAKVDDTTSADDDDDDDVEVTGAVAPVVARGGTVAPSPRADQATSSIQARDIPRSVLVLFCVLVFGLFVAVMMLFFRVSSMQSQVQYWQDRYRGASVASMPNDNWYKEHLEVLAEVHYELAAVARNMSLAFETAQKSSRALRQAIALAEIRLVHSDQYVQCIASALNHLSIGEGEDPFAHCLPFDADGSELPRPARSFWSSPMLWWGLVVICVCGAIAVITMPPK